MLWELIRSTLIFLFLHENICCQGTSNEYPQHMFSWRNKKNIYLTEAESNPKIEQIHFINTEVSKKLLYEKQTL